MRDLCLLLLAILAVANSNPVAKSDVASQVQQRRWWPIIIPDWNKSEVSESEETLNEGRPIIVEPQLPEAEPEVLEVLEPEAEADEERPIIVEPEVPVAEEDLPEDESVPETDGPTEAVPEESAPEDSAPIEPETNILENGCPVDPTIHWLVPSADSCGQFYQCVWGKTVLKECPAGLHFNRELQVCDWPFNAGCDVTIRIPIKKF